METKASYMVGKHSLTKENGFKRGAFRNRTVHTQDKDASFSRESFLYCVSNIWNSLQMGMGTMENYGFNYREYKNIEWNVDYALKFIGIINTV